LAENEGYEQGSNFTKVQFHINESAVEKRLNALNAMGVFVYEMSVSSSRLR